MNKLNFGCGRDIRKGWDNVDIQKSKRLTQSFDFDKFPYPLKENHYDYIILNQVIEYLLYPERTLMEFHKAYKNGAIIHIETAYYTNKASFADMQHMHFFNEMAFIRLAKPTNLIDEKRKFKVKQLKIFPTIIGKFIPKHLRAKLSLFVNGLHAQIHCTYEVIK